MEISITSDEFGTRLARFPVECLVSVYLSPRHS